MLNTNEQMMNIQSPARPPTLPPDLRGFIVDLDGTLLHGATAIPGAIEAVHIARSHGYSVAVVTNNSFMNASQIQERLRLLGLEFDLNLVVSSVSASAIAAADSAPRGRVLVAGSQALEAEIVERGLDLVDDDPDVVVTSIDASLSYDRLTRAVRGVLGGAVFIANNLDRLFVDGDQLSPGGGVIAAAIEFAANRPPDIVVGKPSPHLLQIAMGRLDLAPDAVAMIGDNAESDIVAAVRAGVRSILVLTGTTAARGPLESTPDADYVMGSLADLPVALGLNSKVSG